jgi:glycosyltransferase involved in cell wall biosynthesis
MSDHVSIIMPVYNAENFITESISSVLNQSFTNFTLIVIDDGSTDSSVSLIKKFNDQRIKLYLIANSGVAAARNFGISKTSNSEYIAFIDADDIWHAEKLNLQIKKIKNLPSNKNITFTARRNFIEKGKYIQNFRYTKLFENDTDNLKIYNYITTSSVLLNYCSSFKHIKIFDEDFTSGEDWLAWINLLQFNNYKVYYIDEYLVDYRVSQFSLSSNKINQFNEELKVIIQSSLFTSNFNIIKLAHLHLGIRKSLYYLKKLNFPNLFRVSFELVKEKYLFNPFIGKYFLFLLNYY